MQHNIGTLLQGLALAAILGVFSTMQSLEESFQKLENTVLLNNYRIDMIEKKAP
ncbi:hypothetical protein [Aliamphritea ceti]|uniref:hypothetical protein n=1 Tax=Aliamphritea ceti TaxID=1524258 RepID=UPI0021C44560|nr:hypothetical protein [Aliamphritea ceti]